MILAELRELAELHCPDLLSFFDLEMNGCAGPSHTVAPGSRGAWTQQELFGAP